MEEDVVATAILVVACVWFLCSAIWAITTGWREDRRDDDDKFRKDN